MRPIQTTMFDDMRLTPQQAIEMSLESLNQYIERYHHWAIAYSGGKDSTALVTFVAWAILSGFVPKPESLSVLYADTRMELPPLRDGAIKVMNALARRGVNTRVVYPAMRDRFYCYMFGVGVPPSSNTFRWCTPKLKVEPMERALAELAIDQGMGHWVGADNKQGGRYEGFGQEKLLMLTGVRLGESAVRDQRIALSCSKDSGECGQGWLQVHTPTALADTLAPLLHWRLCHIYDWIYGFTADHGWPSDGIAAVYGEEDTRTGCVGCPLASKDTALERLLKNPEWRHLEPLAELKPLYRELKFTGSMRLRKAEPEMTKDGSYSKSGQRKGPLTMEARQYGFERVMDIQARAGVDLINDDEAEFIKQCWADNVWPNKWSGDEPAADSPLKIMTSLGDELAVQPLLVMREVI